MVLALSNSGETDEIVRLLPAIRRLGAPIVAMTSGPRNSLADRADAVLEIGPVPRPAPWAGSDRVHRGAAGHGDALAMASSTAAGSLPSSSPRCIRAARWGGSCSACGT